MPLRESRSGDVTTQHRILAGYVFLASLPLFVDLKSRNLPLIHLFSSSDMARVVSSGSTRIHIAFLVTVVLAGWVLVRARLGLSKWEARVVLALIVWFTLSVVFGLATGAGETSLVFYSQSVVPLLAWFIGYRLEVPPVLVARSIMAAYCATAIVALVYTLFHGGFGHAFTSATQLENAIPQYRSYFPAIMAVAVANAIAFVGRLPVISAATLALAVVSLPILWSRGGLIMVIVAAVATGAWRFGRTLSRRQLIGFCVAGLAVVAGSLALLLTSGLISQRGQDSNLASSDSNRVHLAQVALDRIGDRPVFGDAFRPYSDVLVGGRQATFSRMFPSHDQYLDYGLRGGVPALLLLVALLALGVAAVLRIGRVGADPAVASAGIGLLVGLAIGSLTELYLTQTWTGTVLLFYLGMMARTSLSGRAPS